jgi:hypothetical protein
MFPLFATGAFDTGCKFAAGVFNAGCKFAAGVVDNVGNLVFLTSVANLPPVSINNTNSSEPWFENTSANFQQNIEMTLILFSGALTMMVYEKTWSKKNLRHCPFKHSETWIWNAGPFGIYPMQLPFHRLPLYTVKKAFLF